MVFVSACGSGATPAAEVAPEIREVCAEVNDGLLPLVGSEPTEYVLDLTEGYLLAIVIDLPDVDTDIGRPRTIIGDEVQNVRIQLKEAQQAYEPAGKPFDVPTVEEELRREFPDINSGAAQFGIETCVDPTLLEDLIIPQLAAAAGHLVGVEPTGDFGVDISAVCDRYRSNQTGLLLDNATDPDAEFLVVTRLRGLIDGLEIDLQKLDAPPDRQADFEAVLTGIENLRDGVRLVETARQLEQDALDTAVTDFTRLENELDDRLEALNPGC